jgi:hypothetical protein
MVHIMHFPLFPQKCMSVSSCPCQWSVCQFLHQWNVCQFLPTCASEVYMSISSHMCQWSVCQCLPTCTTEVYVRFFPSVPMMCISVLPTCASEVYVNFFSHVPVKCMSVSSHLYHWSVCQVLSICANDVYISSSHLCQWSVCQFLLTCASEVYDTIQRDFYNQFHCCVWFSKFVSGVDVQVLVLRVFSICFSHWNFNIVCIWCFSWDVYVWSLSFS